MTEKAFDTDIRRGMESAPKATVLTNSLLSSNFFGCHQAGTVDQATANIENEMKWEDTVAMPKAYPDLLLGGGGGGGLRGKGNRLFVKLGTSGGSGCQTWSRWRSSTSSMSTFQRPHQAAREGILGGTLQNRHGQQRTEGASHSASCSFLPHVPRSSSTSDNWLLVAHRRWGG